MFNTRSPAYTAWGGRPERAKGDTLLSGSCAVCLCCSQGMMACGVCGVMWRGVCGVCGVVCSAVVCSAVRCSAVRCSAEVQCCGV